MICVHCLIARLKKIILLVFQYKYKNSAPEDKMSQDLILCTKICGTGFITQHGRDSDISSIDHLIMREFVSGPPRYHLAIKGVREQFVVVEQNSGP